MGTRVYVGGLPRDATSREIQDGFGRYGHIANVWIARNPPGFAFVDFEDPRDADDAIRSMDGRDFLGGRIRVEIARGGNRRERRDDRDDRRGRGGDRYDRGARNPPQRTEFRVRITDLPRGVDWRDVKDHLRTAGEVTFCNVENDGTAIAEFQSREDMDNAIAKLDDKDFRGSYIRVSADSEEKRSRSRSPRRDDERSPERRSRSRSPAAERQESPERRSRSRSPSPAAGSPAPRKNSV